MWPWQDLRSFMACSIASWPAFRLALVLVLALVFLLALVLVLALVLLVPCPSFPSPCSITPTNPLHLCMFHLYCICMFFVCVWSSRLSVRLFEWRYNPRTLTPPTPSRRKKLPIESGYDQLPYPTLPYPTLLNFIVILTNQYPSRMEKIYKQLTPNPNSRTFDTPVYHFTDMFSFMIALVLTCIGGTSRRRILCTTFYWSCFLPWFQCRMYPTRFSYWWRKNSGIIRGGASGSSPQFWSSLSMFRGGTGYWSNYVKRRNKGDWMYRGCCQETLLSNRNRIDCCCCWTTT